VSAILEQLELNKTFFAQLVTFTILFFVLSRVYFRPFMKLIAVRHARTVQDKEAAEKLRAQAESKLADYKNQLSSARAAARKEYEAVLDEAKKQESTILAAAREEAKKITQATAEQIAQQRVVASRHLDGEVERLAQVVSDRLLSRKGSE